MQTMYARNTKNDDTIRENGEDTDLTSVQPVWKEHNLKNITILTQCLKKETDLRTIELE